MMSYNSELFRSFDLFSSPKCGTGKFIYPGFPSWRNKLIWVWAKTDHKSQWNYSLKTHLIKNKPTYSATEVWILSDWPSDWLGHWDVHILQIIGETLVMDYVVNYNVKNNLKIGPKLDTFIWWNYIYLCAKHYISNEVTLMTAQLWQQKQLSLLLQNGGSIFSQITLWVKSILQTWMNPEQQKWLNTHSLGASRLKRALIGKDLKWCNN